MWHYNFENISKISISNRGAEKKYQRFERILKCYKLRKLQLWKRKKVLRWSHQFSSSFLLLSQLHWNKDQCHCCATQKITQSHFKIIKFCTYEITLISLFATLNTTYLFFFQLKLYLMVHSCDWPQFYTCILEI